MCRDWDQGARGPRCSCAGLDVLARSSRGTGSPKSLSAMVAVPVGLTPFKRPSLAVGAEFVHRLLLRCLDRFAFTAHVVRRRPAPYVLAAPMVLRAPITGSCVHGGWSACFSAPSLLRCLNALGRGEHLCSDSYRSWHPPAPRLPRCSGGLGPAITRSRVHGGCRPLPPSLPAPTLALFATRLPALAFTAIGPPAPSSITSLLFKRPWYLHHRV
jgi:hypothetical protein